MAWFTGMVHGRIDMRYEGLTVDLLNTTAEEKPRHISKSALW
jgi:hypothetical protein